MRILLGTLALTLILGGTYLLSGLYSKSSNSSNHKAIQKIQDLKRAPDREPSSALISKAPSQTKAKESLVAPTSLHPLDAARLELEELKKCYNSEACPFSKKDSRAYEIEIGQRLKDALNKLTQWVRANHIESAEVSKMAREYLENEDGYVKKAALDLISTQPPSSENLQAVLDHSLNSNDSNLTGQSLMEVQKYQSDEDMAKINQVLSEIMTTGSFMVKNRVAELISTHLNPKNVDYFENYSRTLPLDNPVRTYLNAAINEYRRSQMGG